MLFQGMLLPNSSPLYVGIYVDDFVYFSADKAVEKVFESRLPELTDVDFMGTVKHFLGIKFTWTKQNSDLSVHLSQPAFVDHLIKDV